MVCLLPPTDTHLCSLVGGDACLPPGGHVDGILHRPLLHPLRHLPPPPTAQEEAEETVLSSHPLCRESVVMPVCPVANLAQVGEHDGQLGVEVVGQELRRLSSECTRIGYKSTALARALLRRNHAC